MSNLIHKGAGAIGLLYAAIILFFLMFGAVDSNLAGLHIRLSDLQKPLLIFTVVAIIWLFTWQGVPPIRWAKLFGKELGFLFLILLVLGLALRLVYFSYTPHDVRTNDVREHLIYINKVATEYKMPGRHDCRLCYHPPLYFIAATYFHHLIKGAGLDVDMNRALQLFSLGWYTIFLAYGLLLIRRFVPDPLAAFTAGALLVFWPSGIIHSIRIGNDIPFYTFSALSLYYLTLWYQGDNAAKSFLHPARPLFVATAIAAIALFVKSTAVVMLAIIFVTVAWKCIVAGAKVLPKREALWAAGSVALALGISFGAGVIDAMQADGKDWLIGNAHTLPADLFVGNTWRNYLTFDFDIFLHQPFTHPYWDEWGRQYFFIFLFKTALFSENVFDYNLNRTLAELMSHLFLGMLLWMTGTAFVRRRQILGDDLILYLNVLISLAALVALRIKVPAASSNDFRYILPLILTSGIIYTQGLVVARQSGYRSLLIVGYGMAGSFLVSVVLFFLNPAMWEA